MSGPMQFDLYIAGNSERSNDAIRNLTNICETMNDDPYSIRIVDVLENPDAAERQRIIATPTVLRRLPLPSRRLVGDFSDHETVAQHLELRRRQDPRDEPLTDD